MLFCKQSTLVSLETWVPCIPLLINSSPQVLVYKDNDRVIENLKIKKKKYLNNDNSKNISRNFSGAVVGSVGSVQFQIVSCSSLYLFSRSIGPFQCSVNVNYRVLICCTCHFQSSSLFFVYFGFLSFQVSSVSNFLPYTKG